MIAKIAVSAAVYAIDKPYDYLVPAGMCLQEGMRVSVPFGRANRRTEGVVLLLTEGDGAGLKTVAETLDLEPLLSAGDLRLAAFLRERYFCTFYDAIKAILPAGVWFRVRERYALAPGGCWEARFRNPTAPSGILRLTGFGRRGGL